MQQYKTAVTDILKAAGIDVNGSKDTDIVVHNDNFYKLFLKDGRLGLGESYMAGWWDCEDIAGMFLRLFESRAILKTQVKNPKIMLTAIASKIMPEGSEKASKQIGEKHYDVGNKLYQKMLDPYMQYSCGYWEEGATNLAEAQQAKLALLAKKLKLEPGMHVLDVGCGWGGLARYLCEHHDVKVTGVTVSGEQLALAKENCKDLNVDFEYKDYRHVTGQYDRIISVGMFEHVGKKYYGAFFKKMNELLKDDGLFVLHTIGINESNFYNPWLTKYIFPGGYLPSMTQATKAIEGSFVIEDIGNIGINYEKTLHAWHDNFVAHWDEFKNDYDETFYRMWRYYLLSCAPSFRARFSHIWHFVLSKHGLPEGYRY